MYWIRRVLTLTKYILLSGFSAAIKSFRFMFLISSGCSFTGTLEGALCCKCGQSLIRASLRFTNVSSCLWQYKKFKNVLDSARLDIDKVYFVVGLFCSNNMSFRFIFLISSGCSFTATLEGALCCECGQSLIRAALSFTNVSSCLWQF